MIGNVKSGLRGAYHAINHRHLPRNANGKLIKATLQDTTIMSDKPKNETVMGGMSWKPAAGGAGHVGECASYYIRTDAAGSGGLGSDRPGGREPAR